ncbi:MAG: quinone-dependent dihydroorotate dehydrogenase [Rhizobiaceae bacterium]
MNKFYSAIAKPALFSLDAERAHAVSIRGLQLGLHPRFDADLDPRLQVDLAGLKFANPLGMAAGYDKNADVPFALLKMGFGHTETGTVTPLPQSGNPKPRIFRLQADQGVINRLGFNSSGHDNVKRNLSGVQRLPDKTGVIGINIGANKSSEDFAADYVKGVHALAHLADYVTVNISSPNTPGLRALQGIDPLTDLLQRVEDARDTQTEKMGRRVPLFLKVAPDLDDSELDDIATSLSNSDFDALIVSNTTLDRRGLKSAERDEAGGLSGKPLFERSTIILARLRLRLQRNFPLIGVGGITDGGSAISKMEAGADLVQLYSGMIYKGPGLPGEILLAMQAHCQSKNLSHIGEIVATKTEEWAHKPLN